MRRHTGLGGISLIQALVALEAARGPERMIDRLAPRRFTDARIAEAEAKRQRKRAKRAAQLHGKQGGTQD